MCVGWGFRGEQDAGVCVQGGVRGDACRMRGCGGVCAGCGGERGAGACVRDAGVPGGACGVRG